MPPPGHYAKQEVQHARDPWATFRRLIGLLRGRRRVGAGAGAREGDRLRRRRVLSGTQIRRPREHRHGSRKERGQKSDRHAASAAGI